MAGELSIGGLARNTGCKVQTIRYYEQIGLMPEPLRTTGNQRRYDLFHSERLAFIRHSRELGFTLHAIRQLLELSDDPAQPCENVDAIAKDQLKEVDRRIASLQALKTELKRMITQCRGGKVGDCRIIRVLSDHSQCLTPEHQKLL